jgi:hypothetical protein
MEWIGQLRQLLASLRRAMWRTAVIPPERLRHAVDAQGDHRIELVLRSGEVAYTPDPTASPSATFGRSAWATPDGGEDKK